jgi:FkbM family methyltransferase
MPGARALAHLCLCRRQFAPDMALLKPIRRLVRDVQRDFWPTPDHAVLQELERRAQHEPRRTAGEISIAPYQLEYADAMSAWPQWDDIFVRQMLAFDTSERAPRIIDCGANIGLASLYYARRYPHAKLTAIEADPALAAICERNLTRNGCTQFDVKAAAAWTANGETEFICEGADSGMLASLGSSVTGIARMVPTVRLRDYLDHTVDLLKIDIEGAELPVLEDCASLLHHVRALTIEVHEFDPAHRQTGVVLELLGRAGFIFGMSHLCPLPWRSSESAAPFPGAPCVWAVTVFAWRA